MDTIRERLRCQKIGGGLKKFKNGWITNNGEGAGVVIKWGGGSDPSAN